MAMAEGDDVSFPPTLESDATKFAPHAGLDSFPNRIRFSSLNPVLRLNKAVVSLGQIVIDNSSAFRYMEGFALCVPEINADAARKSNKKVRAL